MPVASPVSGAQGRFCGAVVDGIAVRLIVRFGAILQVLDGLLAERPAKPIIDRAFYPLLHEKDDFKERATHIEKRLWPVERHIVSNSLSVIETSWPTTRQ